MPFDKYQQLKIASNILDETITEMAESWDVTLQTVKGVCNETITSARIKRNVDAKIAEAEKKFDEHRTQKAVSH